MKTRSWTSDNDGVIFHTDCVKLLFDYAVEELQKNPALTGLALLEALKGRFHRGDFNRPLPKFEIDPSSAS